MKTFKAQYTDEKLVALFGADYIDKFAANGYPEMVGNPDYVAGNGDFTEKMIPNPDYVPAQGSEQIIDPAWLEANPDYESMDPMDENAPIPDMIDNPDYVPASGGEPKLPNPEYVEAIGEQFIPNPMSKEDWVWQQTIKAGLVHMAKPLQKEALRLYGEVGSGQFQAGIKAVVEDAIAGAEVIES
jgi:hypothetical protein